ncbi:MULTISPECIES: ImmA/IrrE family metallo-endopeptidase [unclassified Sorangium]|uniref:ImmA/IrrE family metallo-endopeptidase n=1 Tax=unclassified Sorangium TaxID=2621164 RepID=UPI003F5E1C80
MSTTSKGDRFEARVFTALRRMISDGQFFASPEACKLFRKKGYYSKDRCCDIVFDISIEVYLPGRSAYSLLILVECKDYNSPVPVNDAEEFFGKIEQVSGAGAKGLLISTNAFAQGTFNYCQSKGIGLVRYYDKSTLKWVLDRSPSAISSSTPDWVDIHTGLLEVSHQSYYFDFYSYLDGVYTHSLYAIFRALLRDVDADESVLVPLDALAKRQPPSVEFMSAERVEQAAANVLDHVAYSDGPVPLEEICKRAFSDRGLIVRTGVVATGQEARREVLGRITFEPLEITIYHHPDDQSARQRFTLAHELGHYFLGHERYMAGEYCQESDFDRGGPSELGIEDIARIEWQANQFASSILLPRTKFVSDFFDLVRRYDLADRGHGALFVDEQPCNQRNFYSVTDALRSTYHVSRKVVEIRLKMFGLLNDARQPARRIFGR